MVLITLVRVTVKCFLVAEFFTTVVAFEAFFIPMVVREVVVKVLSQQKCFVTVWALDFCFFCKICTSFPFMIIKMSLTCKFFVAH